MKDRLAEQLLAEVMDWQREEISTHRPDIQALASYKYDDYQQFSPGMRFVESLALWLKQFDEGEERRLAFAFVRERLVFISQAEIAHLVSMAYPDFIRPLLMQQVADHSNLPSQLVKRIVGSDEYRDLYRRSLFLGLSDGAYIDLFRRSVPDLSNEQVWQAYEMSNEKARKMRGKLPDPDKGFHMIFLLDDFSGSGYSYFRMNQKGTEFGGKVHSVLSSICKGPLKELVDSESVHVYVLLYVATERAVSGIMDLAQRWLQSNPCKVTCQALALQELREDIQIDASKEQQVVSWLRKHYDRGIEKNPHYLKGKHDMPYLGFDECALPLILSHNTPNNSLPILWFDQSPDHIGLFPRVDRHGREL